VARWAKKVRDQQLPKKMYWVELTCQKS
jgi:hypothetical protein